MIALDLVPGDEVIVPSFTYVATAVVIGLLKLKPVMVDVDSNSFNITLEAIKQAITTELNDEQINYITNSIINFFRNE
jgi:UDP-2-acetamido-2-deoxy-ribo-hexuluronate aminotransferase